MAPEWDRLRGEAWIGQYKKEKAMRESIEQFEGLEAAEEEFRPSVDDEDDYLYCLKYPEAGVAWRQDEADQDVSERQIREGR